MTRRRRDLGGQVGAFASTSNRVLVHAGDIREGRGRAIGGLANEAALDKRCRMRCALATASSRRRSSSGSLSSPTPKRAAGPIDAGPIDASIDRRGDAAGRDGDRAWRAPALGIPETAIGSPAKDRRRIWPLPRPAPGPAPPSGRSDGRSATNAATIRACVAALGVDLRRASSSVERAEAGRRQRRG